MDPSRTVNMLLVEDDQVDIMNVKRALKAGHITNPIWIARDGVQALEMLRTGEVPSHRLLILLDLNMPRMNGIEFLQELRSDPELKKLSVVVFTTSDDERDRVEAYNLNVAGYLVKPVTFGNFTEAMVTLNRYWTLVDLP